VRGRQIETFKTSMKASFDARMLVHLRKFFPAQCESLGEEEIIAAVHYGVEHAAGYGVTAERDVCKYIDLMFGLGRDFDKDVRLPWAQKILVDREIPDPSVRIDRLYDSALIRTREQAVAANARP
jgi:hypothetical protein